MFVFGIMIRWVRGPLLSSFPMLFRVMSNNGLVINKKKWGNSIVVKANWDFMLKLDNGLAD